MNLREFLSTLYPDIMENWNTIDSTYDYRFKEYNLKLEYLEKETKDKVIKDEGEVIMFSKPYKAKHPLKVKPLQRNTIYLIAYKSKGNVIDYFQLSIEITKTLKLVTITFYDIGYFYFLETLIKQNKKKLSKEQLIDLRYSIPFNGLRSDKGKRIIFRSLLLNPIYHPDIIGKSNDAEYLLNLYSDIYRAFELLIFIDERGELSIEILFSHKNGSLSNPSIQVVDFHSLRKWILGYDMTEEEIVKNRYLFFKAISHKKIDDKLIETINVEYLLGRL